MPAVGRTVGIPISTKTRHILNLHSATPSTVICYSKLALVTGADQESEDSNVMNHKIVAVNITLPNEFFLIFLCEVFLDAVAVFFSPSACHLKGNISTLVKALQRFGGR
jgi:hypothetical protein